MDILDIWIDPYLLSLLPTLGAVFFYWRGRRVSKQLGSLRIHNVVKRAAGAGRATVPGPVVDALPVMLSCQDLEGRYLFLNARQATIFAVPPENAIGLTPAELLGKRHDPKAAEVEREIIKSGEPAAPFQQEFTDGEGRTHRWLTFKVPVKNESGRVMYMATLSQDMDGGNLLTAATGGKGGGDADTREALRRAEEQARDIVERAKQQEAQVARMAADIEQRQRETDEALARARGAEAQARQALDNTGADSGRADSAQAERLAYAERQLTQARQDLELADARLKQNEQVSLRAVNDAERRARELLEQAERRQADADRALAMARAREAEALNRAKELEQQAEAAISRANQMVAQAAQAGRGAEADIEQRAARMLDQAREDAERYANDGRQKSVQMLADARRQAEEAARAAGEHQQSQRELDRARDRLIDLERQATEAVERANAKAADSDALMRRAIAQEEDARRRAEALTKQAEQLVQQARQREQQIDDAARDMRRREEQVEAAVRDVREREARSSPAAAEWEAERIIARAREREAQSEQAMAYARQKADELLTIARDREVASAHSWNMSAAGVAPPEPVFFDAPMAADQGEGWRDEPRPQMAYDDEPIDTRRRKLSSNLALIAALAMAGILAAALWYRDDLLGKGRSQPGDRRPARLSIMIPPGVEQEIPRHAPTPAAAASDELASSPAKHVG